MNKSVIAKKLKRKIGLALCSTLLLASGSTYSAEPKIDSSKAAFYVGQEAMVCGTISEATPFSKGTYLSMGAKYPKQHLTVLVWGSDEQGFKERFGALSTFVGNKACARGTIETYKNNLQIKVSNPQFLRLMK